MWQDIEKLYAGEIDSVRLAWFNFTLRSLGLLRRMRLRASFLASYWPSYTAPIFALVSNTLMNNFTARSGSRSALRSSFEWSRNRRWLRQDT